MSKVRPPRILDHQQQQPHNSNNITSDTNPHLPFRTQEYLTLTSFTMHATTIFASIVALSATVSAGPLFSRANRKANEFSSGDW
jgi:hypothetical protein